MPVFLNFCGILQKEKQVDWNHQHADNESQQCNHLRCAGGCPLPYTVFVIVESPAAAGFPEKLNTGLGGQCCCEISDFATTIINFGQRPTGHCIFFLCLKIADEGTQLIA